MVRNSSLQMKEHYLKKLLENPSTRKWQVWKFADTPANVIREAEQLRILLLEKLEPYFLSKVTARVVERNNALWSQISVLNTKDFYLVYHPHSDYLFLTTITAKYKDYVREALQNVYDVGGIKALSLEGKDVAKLADLALNQLSQGAFSAYREYTSLFENNPLETHESMAKRRRLALLSETVSGKLYFADPVSSAPQEKAFEDQHETVVKQITNDTTKINLLKETENREGVLSYGNFTEGQGVPSSQPTPEVTGFGLKLHTNGLLTVLQQHIKGFAPTKISRETNNDFCCLVKLEGTDVMNGLDALYTNGLVKEGKHMPRELESSELLSSCLDNCSKDAGVSQPSTSITTLWLNTS